MVTKYKIAVNGTKQMPVTQANNQLVQQLAQNAANQQLQNQAQAQAEAVDPMRQTVNDLLKTKLLNTVEMPRFTTIQDILDAPKGSKLETFGKYIGNNPDITRLIGTLAGGTYMDRQGNFVNAGEQAARRQEALMQANQQKALAQQKEQNDIATALNSAFLQSDLAKERNQLQRDLAKEEMEFKKQEAALNRALQREQLNATIAHQRAMEGIAWFNANNKNKNLSAKTENVINKNGAAIGKIDALISALEKSKNKNDKSYGATGFWQGVGSESSFRPLSQMTNKASTDEQIQLRGQLADLGSMTITDRSGTAQTANELKRLRPFIADAYDNPETAIAKLKGMRNNIYNETNYYLQGEGLSPEDYGINSAYTEKNSTTSNKPTVKKAKGKLVVP